MTAVINHPLAVHQNEEPISRQLPERRACTLEEAAASIGMARSTAYAHAAAGTFPAKVIRVGKRYYVVLASLNELLAA